ncbi:MAG: hypothetical protein D6734_06065 [Candidatus Schekmanbacteria bacterium]|nr:MAG: hypothetical protein D6734_06065 [Candidatus Schekmanbacteria bacterium]
MDGERLFRCIDCNDTFIFTKFDSDPKFVAKSDDNEFIAIYENDRTSLINRHFNHRVVELELDKETAVCDGPFGDPFVPIYIQARDRVNFYVIKKFRNNLEESLKCSVVGEFLNEKIAKISLQKENLLKDLNAEIDHISENEACEIVSKFEMITKKIRLNDFVKLYPDNENYLVNYAVPGKRVIDSFLKSSVAVLGSHKKKELDEFVKRHIEPYDSLNFIVKKKISIVKRKKGSRLIKFPAKEDFVDLRNIG